MRRCGLSDWRSVWQIKGDIKLSFRLTAKPWRNPCLNISPKYNFPIVSISRHGFRRRFASRRNDKVVSNEVDKRIGDLRKETAAATRFADKMETKAADSLLDAGVRIERLAERLADKG